MSATQRIHLNPNAPRAPMMGGGYTPEAVRPRSGGSGMNGGGDDVVSQIKRWSAKAEDAIETYSQVSCFGRLLERGAVRRVYRAQQ